MNLRNARVKPPECTGGLSLCHRQLVPQPAGSAPSPRDLNARGYRHCRMPA